MTLFACMMFLLAFTLLQIVHGCMPTPNIDDNVMFPVPTTVIPIPVTTTPIPVTTTTVAPCSQCLNRIFFAFPCGTRPPAFGRCTSDNILPVSCVGCMVSYRNGNFGSFTPTMMESANIVCDPVSGNYYYGTPNNVLTTVACTQN